MANAGDLNTILLEIITQSPNCDVEELTVRCPQATWNQVFLALDTLSREGRVTLRRQGPGRYNVGLAPPKQAESRISPQRHA